MSRNDFGPWMGVPAKRQGLCAVKDCIAPGKRQICMYDGRLHHHGCIHYDCEVAQRSKHGLVFRPGWGLICNEHYGVLKDAWERWNASRVAAAEVQS